jgi:hypothetical protein
VIFLDTGFLFALFAEHDARHERAVRAFEAFADRRLSDLILTTNYVVAETITLVRVRGHRDAAHAHELAVAVGRRLRAGVFGRVHRATEDDESAAFAYLVRHRDQRYSFVDCLSFVVMERQGIREALTFDDDFAHRFVMIPGHG